MTDIFVEGTDCQYFIDDGLHRVFQLDQQSYDSVLSGRLSSDEREAIFSQGIPRNDLFPTVQNVLEGSTFYRWNQFGNNCLDAAKAQNNVPVDENPSTRIDVMNSNGVTNIEIGMDYIRNEICQGNSVIVGVKTSKNVGNHNKLTGHYINICTIGFELNDGQPINYMGYYDNGRIDENVGTNLIDNRLRFQSSPYGETFVSKIVYHRRDSPIFNYILTEIRRNK